MPHKRSKTVLKIVLFSLIIIANLLAFATTIYDDYFSPEIKKEVETPVSKPVIEPPPYILTCLDGYLYFHFGDETYAPYENEEGKAVKCKGKSNTK